MRFARLDLLTGGSSSSLTSARISSFVSGGALSFNGVGRARLHVNGPTGSSFDVAFGIVDGDFGSSLSISVRAMGWLLSSGPVFCGDAVPCALSAFKATILGAGGHTRLAREAEREEVAVPFAEDDSLGAKNRDMSIWFFRGFCALPRLAMLADCGLARFGAGREGAILGRFSREWEALKERWPHRAHWRPWRR